MSDADSQYEPEGKDEEISGADGSEHEEEVEKEPPAKRVRRSSRKTKIIEPAVEETENDQNDEPEEKVTETKKKAPKTPSRKSKRGKGRKKAVIEEIEEKCEEEETIPVQTEAEVTEPIEDTVQEEPEMEIKNESVQEEYMPERLDTETTEQTNAIDDMEQMETEPNPEEDGMTYSDAQSVVSPEKNQEEVTEHSEEIPTSPAKSNQEMKEEKNKSTEFVEEGEVNDSLDHDTEMVSEDELPSDGPKAPLETEAVSDEELPGPTQAELLDTEAVSEDELPPVKKKRKHRRHSSDSEKRPKADKDKDSAKRSRDSKSPVSKKDKERSSSKPKTLPELDKYWKAVKEDPADFTGWTYLLQYVDQENDLEAAREAYDQFLSHYPYCYGYWRKYADYEKRKGGESSKCEDVFDRGLNAIPLSVDLWLHYLNFCKTNFKDDPSKMREQFKRALDQCGLEFRSDRLWDCYIKWEIENKNYQHAYEIYHKLLATPTQGYKTHFDSFEEFIKTHHPNKVLGVDEFLELRAEVVQKIKEKGLPMEPSAAPPGDDSDGDDEATTSAHTDEETALMRDKLISIGKKIYKETSAEVMTRWNFEEGIKRPYFHVKPLERCQLNTWREYLDYEISVGDEKRTIVLFERCLIACALYEEFWVKYIKYLENLSGDHEEDIRKVYHRAVTIHHPKKPYLALNWASFEESKNNFEGARNVLIQIEKEVPSMMLVHLRRVNLERRAGNVEEAAKLYENYIANTKSRSVLVTLSVKYSRFCWKILNDVSKGIDVIKKAIDKNPDDIRLYVQYLDLLMMEPEMNESTCVSVFDRIIDRESVDLEDKIIFAQRKIEFLEDFGSNIRSVQKALSEYFSILNQLKEQRRHPKEDKKSDDSKKNKSDTALSTTNNSYSSSTYSNPPTSYSAAYPSSGQYSTTNYAQPSTNSTQYGTADQNSSTYQNWNYSHSNYGNGNQSSWGGYNYYS